MLRELNEVEMQMVSGGLDEVVSNGQRTGQTREQVESIRDQINGGGGGGGNSGGGGFGGGGFSISPELLAHVGSLVLPEGVSVGTITLPDPAPTIDPQDPTASQTTTLTGLTFDLGNGTSVTAGANSSGTVGGNITVRFP
ncbi:MAG: hypothetical protein JKY25_03135 [Robiginitomaculum sp.]|nr:hypothetical protein [Robiginitomaculum sp.]